MKKSSDVSDIANGIATLPASDAPARERSEDAKTRRAWARRVTLAFWGEVIDRLSDESSPTKVGQYFEGYLNGYFPYCSYRLNRRT